MWLKFSMLFVGEMNPKDLFDTTLDKNTRRLIKIKLNDKSKADEIVSGVMGKDTKLRKDMIMRGEDNVRDYSWERFSWRFGE